ncbi:hypothetical protein ALC56_07048 [Trachymyrmex septentrionalis]|uniref:Uncharacterized protein n=1 Tax=Trachymyrmex septentrionalis TaxID=34720 RepID=A0A195FD34_9HYME|nr:hypothetical protein ALC56_07048 [Trachymyrmex septentrionalis]
MQLDVECKTTPMADAMLLQLKGQQMKLDASFTKALVKQIECNIPKISIEVWRDYLKECNISREAIAIVYIAQRVEVSLSELDIRSGSIKTFFLGG